MGRRNAVSLDPFWLWLGAAGVVRLIAALTRAHWTYPDAWFQTLEFAQILRGGGHYTYEVELHLRNLTLPTLLAPVLAFAQWVAPEWTRARLFGAQALSGLLSVGLLFAVRAVAEPKRFAHAAYAIAAVVPFWVAQSIEPSSENWAFSFFAWALWFLTRADRMSWAFAGFLVVGSAAIKYPAAALGVGFYLGVLRSMYRARLPWLGIGSAAGLIAFGLADWVFYGLPWESAIAYSEFNLLTRMGLERFGSQSARVYLSFLWDHWTKFLVPVTLAFFPLWKRSFAYAWARQSPWIWALVVYTAAHLLITHKEGRFLIPAEGLLLLAAALGVELIFNWRLWQRRLAWGLIAWTGLSLIWSLRGDWGKPEGQFFEIDAVSAQTWSRVCAVVTPRKMQSFLIPQRAEAVAVISRSGLSWNQKPECVGARDRVLLQLAPGMQTPASYRTLSTHWIETDASVLKRWPDQIVESPRVTAFVKSTRYPSLGAQGRDPLLARLGSTHSNRVCSSWCGGGR